MTDTTSSTCSSCGAPIDTANSDRLCAACLMSGVLRVDAHTLPPKTVGGRMSSHVIAAPGNQPNNGTSDTTLPRELGAYKLMSKLGQGGMGSVYEAVHRPTGRRLALKLLGQSLDAPEMRQRFLREGRLAARVNHPASLYVFGSEEIDGIPAITMEIAPGGTLQDALDRRGPLSVTEAVDAILDIIRGLEAAQSRGVLHRDIKPSNCFVSPDGSVKVGDFGLSVSTLPSADTFATQTGSNVMGTPAFASPEQLRGDAVDVRSDIHSVGATLFALLTADVPFKGGNAVQVVANVIDKPPASLSGQRESIPVGLERVVARCLAKEPAGRFSDYASLRNALLPYSSVVPEPATQSQRTAAGWIDYLTAFLPTYATLMVLVGPEGIFVRPLYDFSFFAWRHYLLIMAVGFAYLAITEGVRGAGLGKWVMGLKVVRRDGRRPGLGRALLRIALPIVFVESIRIPLTLLVLPDSAWGGLHSLLLIGLAIASPWAVAILWLTARRENGFATVWDLATGTRVVMRPRGVQRPVAAGEDQDATDSAASSDASNATTVIGPFRVTSEIEANRWLLGEDPVLRRPIWLLRRESGGPSEARRAVARAGRPRWLQEVNAGGEAWDVYEASRGTPIVGYAARGQVPWSTLRHWLHDLAAELHAAQRDGTLANTLSLGNVWINEDGRALLLDHPWPDEDAASLGQFDVESLQGQQAFLRAVADHVDPLSVPLHARPALQNLRAGSFDKLTFLTGTFRGLLNKPADITRALRAASLFVIPGYAWVATLLGIAANTEAGVGSMVWLGRVAIAGLVMLHFIAFFDVALAFVRKSTGLSTFGLELITQHGRASRTRLLRRAAILWLPVVVPTAALGLVALMRGTSINFGVAALLGAITLAASGVVAGSALLSPVCGLQDRFAGVWVTRR